MSKYFSLFNTEAQYQAAKETLDYPNVSLIDTTGDLHYATYTGKDIIDSAFGDIILCNLSNNKLFNITPSDYNLNDYPFADYTPIAVCIYDKYSNTDNKAVFMSVKYMSCTTPEVGTPGAYGNDMNWGDDTKFCISDTSGNSKDFNDQIRELVTVDWSGSTIPNNCDSGSFPSFECCWRFHTIGTTAGQWMMPNRLDMSKLIASQSNFDIITNSFKKIMDTVNDDNFMREYSVDFMWIAFEAPVNKSYAAFTRIAFGGTDQGRKNSMHSVKAIFYAGVQEV